MAETVPKPRELKRFLIIGQFYGRMHKTRSVDTEEEIDALIKEEGYEYVSVIDMQERIALIR